MMKTVVLFENLKTAKRNAQGVYEIKVSVNADTQYLIFPDLKNTPAVEISAEFIFEKTGVSAQVFGIFNLQKGENVKIKTSSVHKAKQTSCETFIKSVLGDNALFDYRGEIHIEKNASQTNAYLHDDSLTAGINTKRNSQPILEIEANDVKASHGSTTGKIDEAQVYYLQSRGLEKAQAELILKEAFLSGLAQKIEDADIREKVLNKLKFIES